MTTKKYTLYSATGSDDGPKPCAFFASPAGCRNGDKCKFSHGNVPSQTPTSAAAKIPESDSSVSSESDEEMAPPPVVEEQKPHKKKKEKDQRHQQLQQQPKPKPKKEKSPKRPASEAFLDALDEESLSKKQKQEKKRKTSEVQTERDAHNPFAAPKKPSTSTSSSSVGNDPFGLGKKQNANGASTPKSAAIAKAPKKTERAEDTSSPAPAPAASTAAPSSEKKAKREKKSKQSPKPTTSYLNLNLPIASFSIPIEEDTTTTKKEKAVAASDGDEGGDEEDFGSDSDAPQHKPVSKDIKSAHQHPPLPLPTSTEEGRKWKDAVIKTRAHDRYEASFDFERYKENEPDGVESWIKAKPYGQWCVNNPPAIAIDCEMCETRDPVTGANDAKALCRISVVNAVNPDEVLLDTLVKPAWPVVDYRTRINGIKAEHLETVQFTLRHAQAFMMALCSEETVITGHAVHNDLVSLKMEHHCNADSAFLFDVKDEPGATPSLKDLAMAVMEKAMPDTHDSVNDARTALLCLKDYLDKDGNVEPITRSFPRRKRRSTGGTSASSDHLLVHRIPRFCKSDHITQMLLAHTFVQPKEVGEIEFSGATGKVHVYFASEKHARLAFETLSGEEKPDKTGRSQKKVYLRNGDYVQVRSSVKKKL